MSSLDYETFQQDVEGLMEEGCSFGDAVYLVLGEWDDKLQGEEFAPVVIEGDDPDDVEAC
jgi:uncharacterized protein YoaH (UPF0181 family)